MFYFFCSVFPFHFFSFPFFSFCSFFFYIISSLLSPSLLFSFHLILFSSFIIALLSFHLFYSTILPSSPLPSHFYSPLSLFLPPPSQCVHPYTVDVRVCLCVRAPPQASNVGSSAACPPGCSVPHSTGFAINIQEEQPPPEGSAATEFEGENVVSKV